MSLVIVTQAKVIEKIEKPYTRQDGTTTTYYNLKLGDFARCESQTISVDKSIYDQVSEGQDIKLKGLAGGVGNSKWFSFNELIKK